MKNTTILGKLEKTSRMLRRNILSNHWHQKHKKQLCLPLLLLAVLFISGCHFAEQSSANMPADIPANTTEVSATEDTTESTAESTTESTTENDTDHQTYDPETGFWIIKDYEITGAVSFGTSGDYWPVATYADGIFTEDYPYTSAQLVEGIFQKTFLETGNIYIYVEKDADGNYKEDTYYSDGSLQQSMVITVDKAANTWSRQVCYHPEPSDDFAYYTEVRVKFDDSGNIVEYYHYANDLNGNDHIIEIRFDENNTSDVKYDKNGRMIECYHVEDGFETGIQFYYDDYGRLKNVQSTTWYA